MSRPRISMVIAVAIVGVVLSLTAGYIIRSLETERAHAEFLSEVNEKAAALELQLALNFEILRGLGVLFDDNRQVTPQEFSRVARAAISRDSSIRALQWIPRVTDSDRQRLEQTHPARYPGFELREQLGSGSMVRAGARSEYFPVYYVEPYRGNEGTLGFDLGSDPARLEILRSSRDTGRMLAATNVTLVETSNQQQGFLVFQPVYAGDPQSPPERREALRGFIVGIFGISDIVSATWGQDSGITTWLLDTSSPLADHVLYSDAETGELPPTSTEYSRELVDVAGRRWILRAQPTPAYFRQRGTRLANLILIGGVLLAGMATAMLVILIRQSAVVEQLVAVRTRELEAANAKLSRLSLVDGLTAVANRRHLDESVDTEYRRAARAGQPIALLLVDIDHFKLFNDRYGHIAGDACLQQVAAALTDCAKRPADLVARYGGEEFAVLLPGGNTDARQVAEQCRERVMALAISHEDSPTSRIVTVSVGFCGMVPERNREPEVLVAAADQALYSAKQTGRNRVCPCGEMG